MQIRGLQKLIDSFQGNSADTALVLFLLGVETGKSFAGLSVDGLLLMVTMSMLMILPYYLLIDRPLLGKWLVIRGLIAGLGIAIGVGINSAVSRSLPPNFGYLTLSLLILAATASCLFQFYGLMRLRLAK
jgi:hypothetical protein